jgi:hypothetical protein
MIQPNVEYTREQIADMRDTPELAKLVLRGYVLTITIGGNFMFVPWNQAAGGGYSGKGTGWIDTQAQGSSYGVPKETLFPEDELPPIRKRTPQERVHSLMDKVGEDLKEYLSGQAGKDISGTETQEVAAAALQEAEDKQKD